MRIEKHRNRDKIQAKKKLINTFHIFGLAPKMKRKISKWIIFSVPEHPFHVPILLLHYLWSSTACYRWMAALFHYPEYRPKRCAWACDTTNSMRKSQNWIIHWEVIFFIRNFRKRNTFKSADTCSWHRRRGKKELRAHR